MSGNDLVFKPTESNQLLVTSGSFFLRLFICNHPLVTEPEFEVFAGELSSGQRIDGRFLMDPTGKTMIRLEMTPKTGESQLLIEESDKVDGLETLRTLLVTVEGMLATDRRISKRIDDHLPSLVRPEDGILEVKSDFYTVSGSSIIVHDNQFGDELSRRLYIRTSNYDTSKWMLPTSVVLLPKSLRFYVDDSCHLHINGASKELTQQATFSAIINLFTSLHVAIVAFLEHRSYRQRQNRIAAQRRSEQILTDYSGSVSFNAEDRPPPDISHDLLDCLHRYLAELKIDSAQLTYPERFDSDDPCKQLVQILNLSYIPNRVFSGIGGLNSRMIGAYICFQDSEYQLQVPRKLGVVMYPTYGGIDLARSARYLQIFRPLPQHVDTWGFLACMLHGTYLDLTVVLSVSILTALITLLPPIAITYLLSNIIPYSTVTPFIEIVALLAIAGLITLILQLLQSRYAVRLEAKADINLQAAVTNRLLQLPASSILAEDSGDLQSRVSYLSQLRQIFTQTISPLLTQTLTLIFNFGLLFWYSWPVALISLIPLSVLVLSAAYVGFCKGRYYKVILENDGKIFAGLFRYLLGVIPFRTNLCIDFVRARYLSSARPLIIYLFRATRQGNRLNVLDATLRPLTYCFVFPLIVWSIQNNISSTITLASFAGFSTALTTVFTSGRSLIDSTLGQIVQGWAIWKRSLEFLEIQPEVSTSQISLLNISGRIEFRNVSFSYQSSSFPVLSNISFVVKEGDFVGITGESGCGKSTLMRLAYAVLSPAEGSVIYDTHNSTQFNQRALRSNFGVITQDVRLLNASLRENILCGLSRTDKQVAEALENACLTDFVTSLPMGLETMLSERTSTISMGQKQLIIVARALLRSPKVLFMDEATSYLDQLTESKLTENIKSLGITRIAVAHRLSSITSADKILFLDAGRVLGYDSHSNLLTEVPEYNALYQASYSDQQA